MKNEKFQMKNSGSFHISAQNIDCVYLLELPRRASNEYPQFIFLSRNKKINVYPCKPQFYCIKVRFKGVKTIQACFRDGLRPIYIYIVALSDDIFNYLTPTPGSKQTRTPHKLQYTRNLSYSDTLEYHFFSLDNSTLE